MQRNLLVTNAFFVGLLSAAAYAQSLPPLRQGMDYADAHQQLLNAGWQMKVTNVMVCVGAARGVFEKNLCRAGYTNVSGCSANGYCGYNWTNVNGKTLSTTSFGGPSVSAITLVGWKFE